MEFLEETESYFDDVTGLIKAVIAQFLNNLRSGIHSYSKEFSTESFIITKDNLINLVIKELNHCASNLEVLKIDINDTKQLMPEHGSMQ